MATDRDAFVSRWQHIPVFRKLSVSLVTRARVTAAMLTLPERW